MKNRNGFKLYQIFMIAAFTGTIIASRAVAGSLPTIYHLDLQYTSLLPANERYDVRHVAVCLQGLANREASRAFLSFHSADSVWLTRLREPGGLCEGWELYAVGDMEQYISLFSKYANGVVLYDPDPNTGVISSSLVATTAAGVENAIAVRKDTSVGSMYNYLVNDASGPQLPVLVDLTGKFTGSGTIWQTTTPSTGSAKCDAYIWAKEKYIDTGKCDPTTLMYTLDLWGLKEGADLRAQLSNLDYAVQKKGFCFELSPWGDEIATDDPGQPLVDVPVVLRRRLLRRGLLRFSHRRSFTIRSMVDFRNTGPQSSTASGCNLPCLIIRDTDTLWMPSRSATSAAMPKEAS